jgi:hypothetical protein
LLPFAISFLSAASPVGCVAVARVSTTPANRRLLRLLLIYIQIFRTASGDMTSPKSFSALVGKLKQQKASSENASMNLMKQR